MQARASRETGGILSEPLAPSSSSEGVPNAPRLSLPRTSAWIRRLHLYSGLFLIPWSLLYGVTAFLFNHPTAFSDAPMSMFGREGTAGTALENLPLPPDMAAKVVDELNRLRQPATPYKLDRSKPIKFNREYAFATVAVDGESIGVLIDPVNGGGTIRSTPAPAPIVTEQPPFAMRGSTTQSPRGPDIRPKPEPRSGKDNATTQRIELENPLHERMKSAIPAILKRHGFPSGEVTVTSVPDLTFAMEADGKLWTVSYNPMSGSVSGKPAETAAQPVSWRQFLLRLHAAHGYPGAPGPKWYWALIVDIVAAALVFWCASGLWMWWQLKATRRLGFVLIILSAAAAGGLFLGMYGA